MDLDKKKPTDTSKNLSTGSKETKVEELYRLADLLYSTSPSQDPLTPDERETLLQKFRDVFREGAPSDNGAEEQKDGAWVIELCTDVIAYADNEGQEELAAYLRVAQGLAIEMIAAKYR